MGLINPYNGLNTAGGDLANPIGLPNGAAVAPSLYFTNSPTTGLYRTAADSFIWQNAGAYCFYATPTFTFINTPAGGGIALRINNADLIYMDATNFRYDALTLKATGQANGAAAAVGTLNNAPAAGNPTFWLPISINAVGTKYIPCW